MNNCGVKFEGRTTNYSSCGCSSSHGVRCACGLLFTLLPHFPHTECINSVKKKKKKNKRGKNEGDKKSVVRSDYLLPCIEGVYLLSPSFELLFTFGIDKSAHSNGFSLLIPLFHTSTR
jgi:hypothetical protein